MEQAQKDIITKKIRERIIALECPMCRSHKFVLLDGYLTENLQNDYHSVNIGNGTIVPSVAIVCKHCGFIARFALGALDLLPDSIEKK